MATPNPANKPKKVRMTPKEIKALKKLIKQEVERLKDSGKSRTEIVNEVINNASAFIRKPKTPGEAKTFPVTLPPLTSDQDAPTPALQTGQAGEQFPGLEKKSLGESATQAAGGLLEAIQSGLGQRPPAQLEGQGKVSNLPPGVEKTPISMDKIQQDLQALGDAHAFPQGKEAALEAMRAEQNADTLLGEMHEASDPTREQREELGIIPGIGGATRDDLQYDSVSIPGVSQVKAPSLEAAVDAFTLQTELKTKPEKWQIRPMTGSETVLNFIAESLHHLLGIPLNQAPEGTINSSDAGGFRPDKLVTTIFSFGYGSIPLVTRVGGFALSKLAGKRALDRWLARAPLRKVATLAEGLFGAGKRQSEELALKILSHPRMQQLFKLSPAMFKIFSANLRGIPVTDKKALMEFIETAQNKQLVQLVNRFSRFGGGTAAGAGLGVDTALDSGLDAALHGENEILHAIAGGTMTMGTIMALEAAIITAGAANNLSKPVQQELIRGLEKVVDGAANRLAAIGATFARPLNAGEREAFTAQIIREAVEYVRGITGQDFQRVFEADLEKSLQRHGVMEEYLNAGAHGRVAEDAAKKAFGKNIYKELDKRISVDDLTLSVQEAGLRTFEKSHPTPNILSLDAYRRLRAEAAELKAQLGSKGVGKNRARKRLQENKAEQARVEKEVTHRLNEDFQAAAKRNKARAKVRALEDTRRRLIARAPSPGTLTEGAERRVQEDLRKQVAKIDEQIAKIERKTSTRSNVEGSLTESQLQRQLHDAGEISTNITKEQIEKISIGERAALEGEAQLTKPELVKRKGGLMRGPSFGKKWLEQQMGKLEADEGQRLVPDRTDGLVDELRSQVTKKDRRQAMAESRERVKAKRPKPATEAEILEETKPKVWLTGEQVLDEVRTNPRGRSLPVDLSKGAVPPPPGGVRDLNSLRQAASKEGIHIRANRIEPELTPLEKRVVEGGGKIQGKEETAEYIATDNKGDTILHTRSLSDFLAELPKLLENKKLALAEPVAEMTLLADDPDDSPEMREAKFKTRMALRTATLGALIPWKRIGRNMKFMRQRERAISTTEKLIDAVKDPGAKATLSANWRKRRTALGEVFGGMRNPEELFRPIGELQDFPYMHEIVKKVASAKRAIARERNEIFRLTRITSSRLGMGQSRVTTLDQQNIKRAGALADVIDRDILLKLPKRKGPKTKQEWHDAITKAERLKEEVSPEMAARAHEAVDKLNHHQLGHTQDIVGEVFGKLRTRAREGFIKRFAMEEGPLRPWVVTDVVARDSRGLPLGSIIKGEGKFIERFPTREQAESFLKSRAKEESLALKRVGRKKGDISGGKEAEIPVEASEVTLIDEAGKEINLGKASSEQITGMRITNNIQATKGEIDAELGVDIPAYLTRQAYEDINSGLDIEGITEAMPWMNPKHIIAELGKLQKTSKKNPYVKDGVSYTKQRDAFEAVFGPMSDAEFKDMAQRSAVSITRGRNEMAPQLVGGIPKRIFVRFYKQRRKLGDYDTDLTRAASTYASSVLRDIHFSPLLREVSEVGELAVEHGVSPGIIREYLEFMGETMMRRPAFDQGFARATGWMASMVYQGVLAARFGPAINNLIGQTFLIGIPEMKADVAFAALAALADRTLVQGLARQEIIRQSLPLGEMRFIDAAKSIQNARTPREFIGNVKDTLGSATNFMAFSEQYIRMWGFMGGLIEKMQADGMIPASRFALSDPRAIKMVKNTLKSLDGLSPDQLKSWMMAGEDMVRRVAFFFETSNMPRLFRRAKELPAGNLFLQFTNFPINYANRVQSWVRDAFGPKVPREVRTAAFGKLWRHLVMTTIVAGPMGLPLVDAIVDEVSVDDPGLRGQLKRALQPLQEMLGRVNFMIATNRDVNRFGSSAPIRDLASPNRFQTAPVPRLLKTAFDADLFEIYSAHPQVTDEARKARQRLFGVFTPYATGGLDPVRSDVGPTSERFVPEAISTLVYGGSAFKDWMKVYAAVQNEEVGIEGPLNPVRGGVTSRESNPALIPFFGRDQAFEEDRADSQFLKAEEDTLQFLKLDFLKTVTNPEAPPEQLTDVIENITARGNQELLAITPEDIEKHIDKSKHTKLERQILNNTRRSIAEDMRNKILEQIADGTLARLNHVERERRMAALRALLLRLEKGN
jgi:hypothetical protein